MCSSKSSVSQVIFCTITLVIFLAGAASAKAAYKQGEVLIKYRPGVHAQTAAAEVGGTLIRSINRIRVQQVKLPKSVSVDKAIEKLKKNPNVEYVGPNHIISICLEPNDEYFYDTWTGFYWQWGLYSDLYPEAGIDAVSAWNETTGSPEVIIAVIDTGVDLTHPDLRYKLVTGRNLITGASDPTNADDDHGHGTFTAGIAAAQTNNTIGVAGVSWGSKIMPLKALDSTGYGTEADAAAAIIWAADHGADIINMSFGGYDDVPVEKSAVEYAWNTGCILVAASGNDDSRELFYPAAYEEVLSVGATNESLARCTPADWLEGGSNYGEYLDVMAPGNNIMSTWWDYGGATYNLSSGTSAAAPFVSGTAALLLSKYPTWSNGEVYTQIKMNCKDMGTTGWDIYTGWGLINAYHALINPPIAGRKLGELSELSDGTTVKIVGAVLTTNSSDFSDRLYVEQVDRACAMFLPFDTTPPGHTEGDVVTVIGSVGTVGGERAIIGASVTKTSTTTPVKPVAIVNKHVGGSNLNYRPGVTDGMGTNNISLLITTCGQVTATGWTYFYIDDGSKLNDGSGFTGLKILSRNLTKPSVGDYVRVTGVSSAEQPQDSGVSIPVLRPRRQNDIMIVD